MLEDDLKRLTSSSANEFTAIHDQAKQLASMQEGVKHLFGTQVHPKQLAALSGGLGAFAGIHDQARQLASMQESVKHLFGTQVDLKRLAALFDERHRVPSDILDYVREQARQAAKEEDADDVAATAALAKVSEAVVESQVGGGGLGKLLAALQRLTEKEPRNWLMKKIVEKLVDNLVKAILAALAWASYCTYSCLHEMAAASPSVEKVEVKKAKILRKAAKLHQEFRSYRIVRQQCNMMSGRSQRSEILFVLYVSEFVVSKTKIGKWVLVEWTDPESGRTIVGWVKSKYLFSAGRRNPHPSEELDKIER